MTMISDDKLAAFKKIKTHENIHQPFILRQVLAELNQDSESLDHSEFNILFIAKNLSLSKE